MKSLNCSTVVSLGAAVILLQNVLRHHPDKINLLIGACAVVACGLCAIAVWLRRSRAAAD